MIERKNRRKLYKKFLNNKNNNIKYNNNNDDDEELYHSFILPSDDDSHYIRFIILDTRFYRDNHLISSIGSSTHYLYHYIPLSALIAAAIRGFTSSINITKFISNNKFCNKYKNYNKRNINYFHSNYNGDILGDKQWKWLNDTLSYNNYYNNEYNIFNKDRNNNFYNINKIAFNIIISCPNFIILSISSKSGLILSSAVIFNLL